MAVVDVDVSIGCYFKSNAHLWIKNHEACGEHWFPVYIVIVNGNLVVSTQFQFAILVRYGQRVVVIQYVGVQRFLNVVYGVAFCESFHIIAREQFVRNGPV